MKAREGGTAPTSERKLESSGPGASRQLQRVSSSKTVTGEQQKVEMGSPID